MSNDHIMVDLETLGTGPQSAVISIGAVRFDPWGDAATDCFAATISIESAMKFGRIDASTIEWWLGQSNEARGALVNGQRFELDEALVGFTTWMGDGRYKLWGNGATFDNVILKSAFATQGIDWPFGYSDDRCFRTLKSLAPSVKPEFAGTAHNAVDDAVHQALWLQAIVKHLDLKVL